MPEEVALHVPSKTKHALNLSRVATPDPASAERRLIRECH